MRRTTLLLIISALLGIIAFGVKTSDVKLPTPKLTVFDTNKEETKWLLYCDLVECIAHLFNKNLSYSTILYYEWRFSVLSQHYYYPEIKDEITSLLEKTRDQFQILTPTPEAS